MKRIILLGLTLMFTLCLMAQEQYFQAWRYEEGDRFCGEGEPEGILVLSKHDDLLFNITNITDKRFLRFNIFKKYTLHNITQQCLLIF